MRKLVTVLLTLLASAGLVACGGGGGGDENPQQVLDQTFNNDQSIESGSFDVSLKVDVEGGNRPGHLDATVGGPFQSEQGGLPKFDVNADFNFNSDQRDVSFSGGATSTGDAAYINYKDTEYSIPQRVFNDFEQRYVQVQRQSGQQDQNGNPLKALGIDPSDWLTDLSNEGNEDVGGTDTIHIHGQADVPKLVADLKKVAEKAGAAGQRIDTSQLSALNDIVKSADFDVYSGADDHLLRRLDANIDLEPPAAVSGAPDKIAIELSVNLSDVNQEQSIEAPSGARPLRDLFGVLGLDQSQLNSVLGGSVPQAGGSPSGPGDQAVQGYLNCLQSAQGDQAIRACAEQYGIGQ